MNCQKGDTAIIVRNDDFHETIGLPVEIVEAYGVDEDGEFCWMCKPAWPCRGYLGDVVVFNADDISHPDAWLRPIRPEADPVTTDCDVRVEA